MWSVMFTDGRYVVADVLRSVGTWSVMFTGGRYVVGTFV